MTLGGHQSTPLVDDGWMYVVDGYGAVYKIDVRDPQKAKIAWIMDPGIHEGRGVDTLEPWRYLLQELRHFRHRQRQGAVDQP